MLNIIPVVTPGSTLRDVVHHIAITADNELTIAVKNIIGCLATQASIDQVSSCAANKLTIFKLARFTADNIFALIG